MNHSQILARCLAKAKLPGRVPTQVLDTSNTAPLSEPEHRIATWRLGDIGEIKPGLWRMQATLLLYGIGEFSGTVHVEIIAGKHGEPDVHIDLQMDKPQESWINGFVGEGTHTSLVLFPGWEATREKEEASPLDNVFGDA